MDDPYEHEKLNFDHQQTNKDDETQYVECIRLVEGGHIRRFENLVAKFDAIQYEESQATDGPSKPLLFYAIEHNDESFVKVLLEMEVPLDRSYSVSKFFLIHMSLTVFFFYRRRLWYQHHLHPMHN